MTASPDYDVTKARGRRLTRGALPPLVLVFAFASSAFAQGRPLPSIHPDVTVFTGVRMPNVRPWVGFAFGGGNSIFRFEIEYAHTTGARTSTSSSDGSIGVDFLLQSRPSIHGVQFYGTGGAGLYSESFAGGGSGEVTAKNLGAGVKVALAGPVRLRLDYRVFLLDNAPDATLGIVLQKHPQRLSVGLNVGF